MLNTILILHDTTMHREYERRSRGRDLEILSAPRREPFLPPASSSPAPHHGSGRQCPPDASTRPLHPPLSQVPPVALPIRRLQPVRPLPSCPPPSLIPDPRMSLAYFCLSSLSLLPSPTTSGVGSALEGMLKASEKQGYRAWIWSQQVPGGGFRGGDSMMLPSGGAREGRGEDER